MALNGAESIGAMGVDTPLAVLSNQHRPLFDYFKQLFAQVTNPPIDSIREKVVTSTTVYLGTDGNVLEEKAENCKQLKINDPILTNTDLLKIKNMKVDGFKVETIPIIYYKNTSLEKAIDHLFVEVDRAHREGANIIILSDRGVDENHVAIPSLLAVSALQQYLVQTKKRTAMAVILESGEPRDVHHFATLLGYGASAINPYLAQESIQELIDLHMLDKDYYAAVDDYNNAILNGIVKIAEKEFALDDFSTDQLLSFSGKHNDERDIPTVMSDEHHEYSPKGILECVVIPMLNECRNLYLNGIDRGGMLKTCKDKEIWWQMIQLLPSSYNQTRNIMINYEVLANIYKSRKDHKLDEWREFCKWIEELPYSELITGGFKNEQI